MILTITLNPSMDFIYTTNHFQTGHLNRFKNPARVVGGKGINSGRTSAILGSDVIVTGVLAGMNGEHIAKLLETEKFISTFRFIGGETRNAITIMHDNNCHTELVEEGPHVSKSVEKEIVSDILAICQKYPLIQTICLSGSANTGNESFYAEVIQILKNELHPSVRILADISRHQLKNVLSATEKPFFIKPNIHEFSELISKEVHSKADVVENLDYQGLATIPLLMVSCGAEGAIVRYQGKIYDLTIPQIKLVNPTGSGDATVGGIAYGLDQGLPIDDTLKYGMACGIANAMETAVGFVQLENVEALLKEIKINEMFLPK